VATGGVQYAWLPIYALDNPGIANPLANPEFTTEYSVEVIDVYGCINYDTILITVLTPNFWVANAFTPNGDGKSDVFIVRGEGITNFEFGVFNRWGEQLFLSTNLTEGWNGKRTITGEELPAGAYVYYIKGMTTEGEVINTKGMVTLIR
jgi:gliding motility-associated-like protein